MKDTKPTIGMTEVDNGQMWVEIWDGDEGHNKSVIIAIAKDATTARDRAIGKLKRMLSTLETMNE